MLSALDQGAIGTAHMAYADAMQSMMWPRYCRIHRIIRDIRLALQHVHAGVFLKAQLVTSFIWGLNTKPYGSGLFTDSKERLLNVFLETRSSSHKVFIKYAQLIAQDFDMPCSSPEDKEAVWRAIPEMLGSFRKKLEQPKSARWFSWNGACKEQLREFHAAKMIFEDMVSDGLRDPDEYIAFDNLRAAAEARTPQQELAQLKASGGGFTA